jgi:hypothetical protein
MTLTLDGRGDPGFVLFGRKSRAIDFWYRTGAASEKPARPWKVTWKSERGEGGQGLYPSAP